MKSEIAMTIILILAFLLAFAIFLIWALILRKKDFLKIVGWNSSTTTWLTWIGNTSPLSKQMGPLLISPNVNSGLVWTVVGQNVVLLPISDPISENQTWYFYSAGNLQQGTDQWPAYLGINKNQILTIGSSGNLIASSFDSSSSLLAFNQLLAKTCDGFVYLTNDNNTIYYIDATPQSENSNVMTILAQSSDDCAGASNLFFGTLQST
jgi:hypothetical protein